MQFNDIDWPTWQPRQHATLLFVVRNGAVLLIEKKRGIGAGKVNGPGGKVDDGEQPLAAAVREVEEELGVTPTDVEKVGEVLFETTGELSMRIHVFRASDCKGEARETDEAIPLWTPVDQIPYERMWPDDAEWYPLMLDRTPFEVRTLFDDDRMLGCEVIRGTR